MPFNPKLLRVERVNLTMTYHATWSFYGLKGVIAERWAHGPIFGAVTEVGTTQLNLTPALEGGGDQRLQGVLGYRLSGLMAEGKEWTTRIDEIAPDWFSDVMTGLKPQRVVNVGAEIFGLYPVRDEWRLTQRLRLRYYKDDVLSEFAGSDRAHAAVEVFDCESDITRSIIMGAVGPPHRGMYFTYPDKKRDDMWWLGVRLTYAQVGDEGLDQPESCLQVVWNAVQADWDRISRTEMLHLIA